MKDLVNEYKSYADSETMQMIAREAHDSNYCGQTSSATFAQIEQLIPNKFKNGLNLMDLGCGNGTFALQLAKMYRAQSSIVGVDISGHLVNIANKNAEKWRMNEVCKFYIADFTASDFMRHLEYKFDVMLCIGSLYWGLDLVPTLSNWKKMLSTQGVIVIFANMQFDDLSETQTYSIGKTTFIKYADLESALHKSGLMISQRSDDTNIYVTWLEKWNCALDKNYTRLEAEMGVVVASKLKTRFLTYRELAVEKKVKRMILTITTE